jgi:malonyl-CoA/methylmalonyl-CoA synthetase
MRQGPLGDAAAWAAHGFHGDPGTLTAGGSLARAWTARWAATPTAPVLRDDATGWVTAGELADRTAAVAGRFAAAGLGRGDRILMSSAPSVDLVVAHVAALRLGAVVVPVNTALSPDELARAVTESRTSMAVLDDASRLAVEGVRIVGPDVDLPAGPTPVLDATGPDDPALLVFTSGTTGRPKGASLSHGNLLASAEALRIAWGWEPGDRLVLGLPLFHMHGLGVGVHGTLLAGASAVIVPRFDVDTVLDVAGDEQATLFFGVPTMYVRLAESHRVGELARLRLCVSGSAPMAPDLWTAISERGGQRVLERYGMTETAMNVSNPLVGDRRPGSVGLALPGVRVRLADPAAGGDDTDGPDAPGEILLQGPNVMRRYWERPDATAEAFDEAGWFRSGDVGRFDPDGYLRIVGRSKDIIITGGYNVYPRDVEEVLREHPAVADAAVVGRADPTWGETVVACVITREAVSADDLAALCTERLAPYKRPREWRFVDEFPRNALGKVLKAQLLD